MRLPQIPFAPACLVALALALVGCAETRPGAVAFERTIAATLLDNQSTREQILLKFGEPSAQFENQRIATYRVYVEPNGDWGVVRRETAITDPQYRPSWEKAQYSLVLVFDGPKLVRHSLVPIK